MWVFVSWYLSSSVSVRILLGCENLEIIMSCLQASISVTGSNTLIFNNRDKGSPRFSSSIGSLQFRDSNSRDIWGKTLDFPDQKGFSNWSNKAPNLDPVHVSIYSSFRFIFGQIFSDMMIFTNVDSVGF